MRGLSPMRYGESCASQSRLCFAQVRAKICCMRPEQEPPSGTRAILLTKGWVAWVDVSDYVAVAEFSWSVKLRAGSSIGYAVRSERGVPRTQSRKVIFMHRAILELSGKMEVDHINHLDHIQVVDNRRSNLRVCDHHQNGKNQRKVRPTASRFKGVTRTRRWWQARIMVDGKTHQLGCFDEEREAALAYDTAARKFHGQYARTNFSELAFG